MQVSSKLLVRTAIVLLGVMLAMVVLVAVNSQQANALSTSQWEKVRGYVNEYFGGPQYNAGEAGELGFRITKVDLAARLDSNNDIAPKYATPASSGTVPAPTTVTGVAAEGDNMANRPVLIDNLMTRTDVIPGTEFRCNWNVDNSCFADSSISAIRTIVDNHKAAGFSTDIVDYCVSAQTAGPTTGGFGIIAQVPGALSSDLSLTPNVYTLKYARNGWRNYATTVSGANGVTVPEAPTGVPNAAPTTVANCDASATDYDLVRCQANWAIAATLGNIGNGSTTTAPIAALAQTVDIRPGTVNTVATAGVNMQVPIDTLFSLSGLANVDPTKSTALITHTQHGADAAIGMKMLGYNLVAASGSLNAGIVRWDSTQGEQQVVLGDNLPTQTIAAFAAPGPVDTTGPTVTSVGHTSVTTSSADIERAAAEPATMKVEYGTTSGGPYTGVVNDTVLNATKDVAVGNGNAVSLTGLSPSTTYYYKVTSYDGYANGTVSVEGNFTTLAPACTPVKPNLGIQLNGSPFWASYADYTAGLLSVGLKINNNGANAAGSVAITGATAINGVTLATATPIAIGSIAGGASGTTTVQYNIPAGVIGFNTAITASASDASCSVPSGYTYP
ncbi:MAG: fibronectin type III domain-containing protein [Actinobacteria bacterium]|nr:fibronectin type III domain-containing protein [Actinomycetota bacterium]